MPTGHPIQAPAPVALSTLPKCACRAVRSMWLQFVAPNSWCETALCFQGIWDVLNPICFVERANRSVAHEVLLQLALRGRPNWRPRKAEGLIASARNVFEELHASDFRIAATVIQTVLELCGK